MNVKQKLTFPDQRESKLMSGDLMVCILFMPVAPKITMTFLAIAHRQNQLLGTI